MTPGVGHMSLLLGFARQRTLCRARRRSRGNTWPRPATSAWPHSAACRDFRAGVGATTRLQRQRRHLLKVDTAVGDLVFDVELGQRRGATALAFALLGYESAEAADDRRSCRPRPVTVRRRRRRWPAAHRGAGRDRYRSTARPSGCHTGRPTWLGRRRIPNQLRGANI